jgi:hypothetical protein
MESPPWLLRLRPPETIECRRVGRLASAGCGGSSALGRAHACPAAEREGERSEVKAVDRLSRPRGNGHVPNGHAASGHPPRRMEREASNATRKDIRGRTRPDFAHQDAVGGDDAATSLRRPGAMRLASACEDARPEREAHLILFLMATSEVWATSSARSLSP